jgi:hypothetical protein
MSAASMKATAHAIAHALGSKPEMEPCRACGGSGQWRSKRPLRVVTSNIFPPIPDRRFDWIAYYEGEEEAGSYGYGSTEAEAIADFNENYREDHDRRLGRIDECGDCEGTGERPVYLGFVESDELTHAQASRVERAEHRDRLARERA